MYRQIGIVYRKRTVTAGFFQQRHALVQFQADVRHRTAGHADAYLSAVNGKIRILFVQGQEDIAFFAAVRQYKTVVVKILDLRRGQARCLHLQGVSGNGAVTIRKTAEQRAIQNRSFFFF